jgi:hypothetical protein
MDLILIVGIVGVGLIIFAVVAVMLNRAWGDFPGRISGLPPTMPTSQPPSSRPSSFSAPSMSDAPPMADTLDITPNGEMIPINHPLVRKAVVASLERGGSPYALYFIKDGEAIYLVPSRIADQQQREVVTRLFTSLNNDSDGSLSFGDVIRVMQDLGRK